MIIKFSVDGIKNMSHLYTWTNAEVFEGVSGVQEDYHGTDYCKLVIEDIETKFPGMFAYYKGMIDRIANEKFAISLNGREYELSFGIKTYNREAARIECSIIAPDSDDYNHDLEEIKIALKDRLLIDWKVCTWLVDEQAENLCKDAFQLSYHVENNLRAFASKVLIHFLGVNWIESYGFDKMAESVKNLKPQFIQRVPEFDNINTDFLSMTLETLVKIMFKGVIYENEDIKLSRQDFNEILNKATNKKSVDSVVDLLEKKLNIQKRVWEDLFVPYIEQQDDFKRSAHDFIGNRNHVAHSKVLAWNSYLIITQQFNVFDELIKKADEKFESEEASQEVIATWYAEDDMRQEQLEQEEYEKSHFRDRLSSETGMDILSEDEILDWFDEVLQNLYDDLYRYYNLDVCYELSDYINISDGYELFSISCPAVEDGSAIITISVDYDIDDGLGENSICSIICKNGKNEIVLKAELRFHNGNGFESDYGEMEADESTEYDDSEIEELKTNLIEAIDNLNPYPDVLANMEYESKGSESYVADFPCDQCNKFGISINEAFLPIGRCCYCGYENELVRCFRCDEYVSPYLVDNGYCPSCAAYIEKQ